MGVETKVPRSARLGVRLDPATKELVERAAALERRSLTDFCLSAMTDAARRTIEAHETLELTARDRALFFEALITPPAPNEKLRQAFKDYEERFGR